MRAPVQVYGEGTHVLIPWIEIPIIYDVRSRPETIMSDSGSRDLQMVKLGLRVLTKPNSQRLADLYRRIGPDYKDVLPSLVHEVRGLYARAAGQRGAQLCARLTRVARPRHPQTLKSVVAQYNASQLLTQREMISREIRRILTDRCLYFDIILEDVAITHLTFGKEYTAAVEAKQVAQQEAEASRRFGGRSAGARASASRAAPDAALCSRLQRAKFLVEKAKQEKEKSIVQAQGEAQSARLIGEAIQQNPAFLTLRRIEAAREVGGPAAVEPKKARLQPLAARRRTFRCPPPPPPPRLPRQWRPPRTASTCRPTRCY